jgi:hypothetical protein
MTLPKRAPAGSTNMALPSPLEPFTLAHPPEVVPPPPSDPIPTFDAVNIRASDGSVWRIRVTPMGSMLLDRIVT